MNSRNQTARLHYIANGFRVLSGGDHVICATTGNKIMLDELRYWSVLRQEPYSDAAASASALLGK